MSPLFKNDRPHAVRVAKPNAIGNETLQRILPGKVVEADGAYADNLSAAGLAEASEDDRTAYEEQRARDAQAVTPGMGTRLAAKLSLGPLRVGIRQALIVAPLRRVVGDDMAPYGPPSGVITTKGAVVGDGSDYEARRAFADNEAVAGQRVPGVGEVDPLAGAAFVPTQAEVHNSQVTNAEQGEVATEAFITGDIAGADAGAHQASGDMLVSKTRAQLLELAEERGVSVEGTGAGGYVRKMDVVNALTAEERGEEPPSADEQAEVRTSSPDEESGEQEQSAPLEPLPAGTGEDSEDEDPPASSS